MKLRFDDITVKPTHYTIKHSDWFPREDQLAVSAEAHIVVNRRDQDHFVLRGELVGTFTTPCGRCGVVVEKDLQSHFEYLVTRGVEQTDTMQESECKEKDVNTLYTVDPEINIDEILCEQTYLEIPLRTLCKEECRGICVGCGVDLNKNACSCARDNTSSPFAVLSKLKKEL